MQKNLGDLLCNPPGTTSEQEAINETEWRKPENWHGLFFPSYASELDTRPFVKGRMYRPKFPGDLRWVGVLCVQTPNRGHPRGRVWSILGWAAIIGAATVWFLLLLLGAFR